MRIVNVFCVALCLFALCSCSNEENKLLSSDKLVYLEEDNLPVLQEVEFEKIDLPENECMYSYYYVYHDSVLVVMHRTPNPYWLTIMNLNSKEVISNYIAKGNGPEEMLFCYNRLSNNRLIVSDPQKGSLKFFNLDSVMQFGMAYNPQMLHTSSNNYKVVDVLTDTSFVFYNNCYFDNCGIEVNKGVPELIVTGKNADYSYVPPRDIAFIYVISVNNVLLHTDLVRQRTFISYESKPQFTLLNSSLDTIKIICGPDPMEKAEYVDYGDEGGYQRVSINNYVISSFSTENYIFVENDRLCNVPRKKIKEIYGNLRPEMFKFDWDGNVVARYKIRKCFNLAGFSEATNTLYVTMFDEDGELCLYKAQL